MQSRSNLTLLVICLLLCVEKCLGAQPNVLFIAVDDLRPQLGCYGKTQMHSPNIDQLAEQGVLFEHAYCMVPTCGASRASLMTSIRPSPKRFTNYLAWAEKEAPDALPLHSHFKANGYLTFSFGKVFHHKSDHADGWTQPAWRSSKRGYQDREAERVAIQENRERWPDKRKHRGLPFEVGHQGVDEYPDGDCASRAIRQLRELSKNPNQPFFLAVGFLKPHLPFNAPKKYWELYDSESIDLPDNYYPPEGAPSGAVHNSGELRAYTEIPPKGPVQPDMARKLIHGYYACVSYTDAQIGRVLRELERSGLSKNTIVVLWGDHGWQLGEHGMWNKHSCFETSMHAPLLVSAPMLTDCEPGTRVSSMVEFIDIYPALCELAGIEIPAHVQGESFVPSMRDPTLPGKQFAVGRYGKGETIRSQNFRFSEYFDAKGRLTGEMLYDHRIDPDENSNIASGNPAVSDQLSRELAARKGK